MRYINYYLNYFINNAFQLFQLVTFYLNMKDNHSTAYISHLNMHCVTASNF